MNWHPYYVIKRHDCFCMSIRIFAHTLANVDPKADFFTVTGEASFHEVMSNVQIANDKYDILYQGKILV